MNEYVRRDILMFRVLLIQEKISLKKLILKRLCATSACKLTVIFEDTLKS